MPAGQLLLDRPKHRLIEVVGQLEIEAPGRELLPQRPNHVGERLLLSSKAEPAHIVARADPYKAICGGQREVHQRLVRPEQLLQLLGRYGLRPRQLGEVRETA